VIRPAIEYLAAMSRVVQKPFDIIDFAELVSRREDPDVAVVDVLPPATYRHGHLPGALNLPLASIEGAAEVLPDKRQEIILYCAGFTCTASEQAAVRLQGMGYENVREYAGGMADWLEHGGQVDSATGDAERSRGGREHGHNRSQAGAARRNHSGVGERSAWGDRLVDAMVLNRSIGQLLGGWLAIVFGFGLVYWLADLAGTPWMNANTPGRGSLADLGNAIYFSFVTALTIGYGDIAPLGPARVLAVVEGAAGLLAFGFIVSKLVSRRQEELMEDTHRIAFEQRLGRVRTSVHLVLSELQTIARMCAEGSVTAGRVRIRTESTLAVFEGELHTVHDLLYNPEQIPEEQDLESILASIAASLEVLNELLGCLPEEARDSTLMRQELRQIRARAVDICADCVPHQYTDDLAGWMDRVQDQAARLG